jgi:U4/U6.U5 tri-snRNP-associated protein 1
MKEEVIELSIEETQALRAKLGLAPLRLDNNDNTPSTNNNQTDGQPTSSGNDKEISLSIDETNALRLKLGLAPLQLDTTVDDTNNNRISSTSAEPIHAPPPTDKRALQEAQDRIQDAKDKRGVADKLDKWKEEENHSEGGGAQTALDFAAKLRKGSSGGKTKKKKKGATTLPTTSIPADEYTPSDLQGIKVAHDASSFQTGSTTILTLSDKQILNVDEESKKITGVNDGDDMQELTNVNMMDDTNALENLKKKRQIELGAGRAGGYAGFDDDEFEEFGGVLGYQGDVLGQRGPAGGGAKSKGGGFAIGQDGKAKISESKKENDLFSSFKGGAISLESRHGNNTIASDFITEEEMNVDKEERAEKERKRQMKLLEKMRKKDKKKAKKDKKKNKRSELDESDDEDGGGHEAENAVGGNSLLESLEATAVKQEMRKKRRRDGEVADVTDNNDTADVEEREPTDEQIMKEKRSKFDRIMEKGKARTDRAFKSTAFSKSTSDTTAAAPPDDEEDDAFLNAALAKARRIQRLKELNGDSSGVKVEAKGENAVLQAIDQMKKVEADAVTSNNASESKGGITFENDEMQEFTRALRAREDQVKRAPEKSRGVTVSIDKKKKEVAVKEEEGVVQDVDMEELANEMEEDDDNNDNDANLGGFDATSGAAPIGRGMSNFLSMLKQTGEIKQHATREEMRGRAKDKRTYEDYDHLNLKEVVKINTQNAQEKDLELANREIKLEYRDEHGRLLTRKEAYREMCYQFHGHGASKKNQERKMKQIEREREEAQLASRQAGGVGTLGALKATQKATGKAFIIHKT